MEVKMIHCGQYRPYGDFFRVWEVKTNGSMSKEEVVDFMFENYYKRRVPPKGEWSFNIRYGNEHFSDPDYYFRGWYTIEKNDGNDGVYTFTVCEPFCD